MFNEVTAGDWGQIIVGIAALIVAIAAIAYSRNQIDKRKLVYQVKLTPIIKIDGISTDDIEIKFRGTTVKTLALCSVSILNLGNRPILRKDWDENLRIDFEQQTKIVDTRIASSIPKDLTLAHSESVSGNKLGIEFQPFLLNSKEGFKIEIVVAGNGSPRISGRIVGITRIEELGVDGRNFVRAFLMALITVSIASALALMEKLSVINFSLISPQLAMFLTGLTLAVFYSYFGRKFPTPLHLDEGFSDRSD
jgi:hypothetical protein